MVQTYLPRVYDSVLRHLLGSTGAVLVEGAKWCGKTTTAEQVACSAVYFQDPRTRDQNELLARIDPSRLLDGDAPRLLDEWQVVPQLWDAIRFEVDHRGEDGQFIITGSSVPANLDEVKHSGTGRIARMIMRPMALAESGDSNAGVSLEALFARGTCEVTAAADDGIDSLAHLVCRGGWPRAVGRDEESALQQAYNYLDAVCEVNISRVDGVKRDAHKTRALLRSYARMISSEGSLASMRVDMSEGGSELGESAFLGYVAVLRKLFVLDDLRAWSPNLRSKTAIRTTPTRHFVDPSIAAAALGAGPGDLVGDLNTFGLVFEDMCVRDLRAYAAPLMGDVFHYRDKTGLECDAVVHLRNGSFGLVEVKLGGKELIEEGARNLLTLAAKIDTDKMRQPSFLMVLVGVGAYSYPREDGVLVVPLRALGA